ncbi:MAG: thioesterase family protein [Limnobacter sp.]|nr:thioesterase family protein [Limnobacter sp.]
MSTFDDETRLQRLAPDAASFAGHVHPGWNIGTNPNGGYLLAIAGSAMRELVPQHPDPLSVTVHYLRPGLPEKPCRVDVQLLHGGRSKSTLRATLVQEDTPRLEVLAAFGVLASEAPPELTIAAPAMPAPEQCLVRSADEQGVQLPILDRIDIRLHPNELRAGAAGKARVSGWVRFHDGRPPDTLACLLLADAFPPAVFGLLGMVGWVPTLELTVHVRRRPVPGWILGRFETFDLSEGRLVEDGALWDSAGNLVAQSRQLAMILRGGR